MSKWSICNSRNSEIFVIDGDFVEMWNSFVFNYSKLYGEDYFLQNYLFYKTSQDSDFSKEEMILCLDFSVSLLNTLNFKQNLTEEDADAFENAFNEMKKSILKESESQFQTHFSEKIYHH